MGIIIEPESVDFVIEPHEVTEDERLDTLAFIAACKEQKKKQQDEINKRKRKYEPLVASLYRKTDSAPIMGIIREPEGVDFVIEPHEVTEDEHLDTLAFIAACKKWKKTGKN